MKPAETRKLDVAVIGGGLAGNALVRQLLRALPGISLAQFEKTGEPDYRVGESTVELASNYLIRRLGLSRYMYEEQLPKNGLRYFFDDPTKSTPLEEMSEIGSQSLPFHPSFQIDRARLDADLRRMSWSMRPLSSWKEGWYGRLWLPISLISSMYVLFVGSSKK